MGWVALGRIGDLVPNHWEEGNVRLFAYEVYYDEGAGMEFNELFTYISNQLHEEGDKSLTDNQDLKINADFSKGIPMVVLGWTAPALGLYGNVLLHPLYSGAYLGIYAQFNDSHDHQAFSEWAVAHWSSGTLSVWVQYAAVDGDPVVGIRCSVRVTKPDGSFTPQEITPSSGSFPGFAPSHIPRCPKE